MRAGVGLIGLLLAVLLVMWLVRPAKVTGPAAPPSALQSSDARPQSEDPITPEDFRRALDAAVQSRTVPAEAE